jgi:hypothetical protein
MSAPTLKDQTLLQVGLSGRPQRCRDADSTGADVPLGTNKQEPFGLDASSGLGTQLKSPTLHSVRRMRNLIAARGEINRRLGAAGGFPFEAYVDPKGYARRDPNIYLAYYCHPMKYLQGEFAYCCPYVPEPTVLIRVKGRVVENGTISSKIIERAILRKLSINLDRHFSDQNYAFRPGRSTQMAILRVREAIRRGLRWALKCDISQFFPTVNREILERQLRHTLADQTLCEFILCANAPRIRSLNWGKFWQRTKGIPQGNILSPFLSNLHLNGFDRACSELEYARYADDILVLGSSREEVVAAREQIKQLLSELGLSLNPEKTFIRDLYKKPLTFLGYQLRGGNVYPPMKAILRFERKLRVRGQEARKLNLMKGFVNRYRIGPVRKLFRRIDRELRPYYPVGATLTGILDRPARVRKGEGSFKELFAGPKGKAAQLTAKKAHLLGQGPVAAAAGEQDADLYACSLAPMEVSHK